MDKFKKQIKTSIFIAVIMSSFFLYLLFSCGGDPAGVTSPISVTTPVSSTVWEHYQDSATIEWNGGSTDNVSIKLLEAGEAVTTLASTAPNSGTYILSDRVSPSWGTGTDFTIRIEDGLGEIGNSSQFEITVSSGEEIIQVTNPTSSTQWQHYEEDVTISWSYPSAKATESASRVEEVSTTRSTGTLSGDSVDIELYQGEDFIATLGSGVSSTAGSYTYAGPVPLTWGTGTDFKVRVVDDLGNYGFSSEFSITESSGQEVITVTEPTSSTEWEYEQTGTTVNWEYPDKGNSDTAIQSRLMSHSSSGTDSDNVRIEIWHDGVKIDDFSGWVSNTGSYTRNDPLPSSWCGFDYQIKVIDEDDNYGSSENFTIAEPSGEEIITVTEPNSSTEWEYEQTETTVEWSFPYSGGSENRNIRSADNARHETDADSVRIELWYQGSKVADYSGWIANTGNYTRVDPLSSSWCGSDYQIKVIDSNNNYGSSENFTIAEPSGEEIIAVIEPNSSTEWEYEQMETTVEWSFPYSGDSGNRSIRFADIASSGTDSDNVRIEIWHDGVKIDDFSGWVSNTGSYTRNDPLPSSWCGFDYQIKVIDEDDNYGSSENFTIAEPSGEEIITVTEPNSSTEWEYEQTETTVEWSFPYSGGSENRNIRSADNARHETDADSVRIELWYQGSKVADYSGWIANTGNYTRVDPLSSSWCGSDYQIKVIDSNNNYGSSENFTIAEPSGEEIIAVIEPNSSTEWEYEQMETTVEWSFPYSGDSGNRSIRFADIASSGTDSDNVRIEIWHDGVKLDDYSGWVPNTGSYTRNDPLPASWGTGFNYYIRIIDENDNYGISEDFLISGTIDVSTPDASTIWEIGETNTQTVWNGGGAQIKLEVWYDGEKVDDYSGWIDNNGNYTRSAPIPSSWSIGEHFRIRVVEPEPAPNDGYSDEFQIFDEVNVTTPDSETMWAWGEEGVTVQWSENYSDSVYINVYKDGSYLASFSSWVPNSGSYTRTSPIPSSWGTGEDFQIKVVGSLGSTGLSEEFSIWAIDIIEPDSSTGWWWNQTNTQVLWELAPGSIVRMEIWQNGSKIDDYCGWTDNDGADTRSAPIPEAWGEGDNYTLKMIDDLNNIGWSEEFSISISPVFLFQDTFDRSDANNWGSPDIGSTYTYNNPGHATYYITSNIGYMDDNTTTGDPAAISSFATTATNYTIQYSWKYEGGRGSGILLYSGSSHITGIAQVEDDDGKLQFYNGTSYVDIENRIIDVWKDYKLVVNGATAMIYIDDILILTTTVEFSSVNNIKFWAQGGGNPSDSWYNDVLIYDN